MPRPAYDAVVIGGGFFGCSVARHLAARMRAVLVVEQEPELCRRASFVNQARIHNGYHYPRSLHTAYRSRVNFRLFVEEFPECVVSSFVSLYGIGRRQSKVSARQFERFCALIGAPLRAAREKHARLFDARLVQSVYEATEYAFDAAILRRRLHERLEAGGIELRLNTRVDDVRSEGARSRVRFRGGDSVETRYVFNCTYAGLRRIPGTFAGSRAPLKQEIAELVLIDPPDELRDVGITVMDGPFFSTLPFPPRSLHSLSHVRYTPHCSWIDEGGGPDPYEALAACSRPTRAHHMLKDARRYVPLLDRARIVDSLFEVKTLLVRSELDDGRPILFERGASDNPVYSVMGGKIDNVYDVIERLDAGSL